MYEKNHNLTKTHFKVLKNIHFYSEYAILISMLG